MTAHGSPGRNWSRISDQIDTILAEAMLGRGTRVALVGRSRPALLAALYGVLATRRCAVLINPFVSDELLAETAADKAAPVYVADPEDWARPAFRSRVAARGAIGISLDTASMTATPVEGLTYDPGLQSNAVDPETALIISSSGTTGKPKATCYSNRTLTLATEGHALWASRAGEAPPQEGLAASLIVYAPVVHISGLMTILQAGFEGRCLYCLEKFTPEGWLDAVRDARVRMGPLPPAMLRMILDSGCPREDLASIRAIRSGGAALDDATREKFESIYGIPIMAVYGATEYGGVIAGWSIEDWHRYGATRGKSAGRLDPDIAQARTVDPDTGEVLPDGQEGVLEVRVPRIGHSNWIRTTDIASIDELGFLFIHGRTDDAINRGGFKVLPAVVEAALREHDLGPRGQGHRESRRPPRAGAVAAVELVKDAAEPLSGEDLRRWLRGKLVAYQIPAEIRVLDALPRVTIGKINIGVIKAMFTEDEPVTEG